MALPLPRRTPSTQQAIRGGQALHTAPNDVWDIDPSAVAGCRSACSLMLETFFQASRTLRRNNGTTARSSHVFRVQLSYSFDLNGPGEGPSSQLVRERLDALARQYVGKHLNDLPPFRDSEPVTEQLAAVIYYQLDRLLRDLALAIDYLTVYESPTQAATCRLPTARLI